MKLNWGTGITIAIIAFMSFIIYIVVQTFNLNADLVRDDFYEQEVKFNGKKVMIENYIQSENKIAIAKLEEGIQIVFPLEYKNATGTINFYRPDDKSLDRTIDISLGSGQIQLLEYENFKEGRYEVNIQFEISNKAYLHQSILSF